LARCRRHPGHSYERTASTRWRRWILGVRRLRSARFRGADPRLGLSAGEAVMARSPKARLAHQRQGSARSSALTDERRSAVVPSAPVEFLSIPNDEQRGFALWNWWLAYQVEQHGWPLNRGIPAKILEQIRVATLKIDTNNPKSLGAEKALRLAA